MGSWTLDAYPRARPKRGTGVDVEDIGPVVAPRMRIFPFALNGIGQKRTTISFPQLQGPALIKSMEFNSNFGQDPPGSTIELGTSTTPVSEVGVNPADPRPYTTLFELQDPMNYIDGRTGDGFPMWTVPAQTNVHRVPLDLIVQAGTFYLVLSVPSVAGVPVQLMGHIRVLERVDPEALRFFL